MTIAEQKEKIRQLENEIKELKEANTKFLEQTEQRKNEKPVMLLKIMEIANEYGLDKNQKEELIKNAIKLADEFRKENKESRV